MAATNAVWGIDVGQCALKALRCSPNDDPEKITAEAFDFIEYPKILSQPGSDPGQLIGDALQQFLSRNSVRGDRVAISVSGQNGLARFIKLPPVEAKKIPDIVRYEARQQIPFDLNDVIWDYQRMGGGSEEEGFALETEIGLFAMKRDAVFRALDPFRDAGIEVDMVQLTPLALYNYALFDTLDNLPSLEEYDPENPPESVVVISLGTDATDLVVTNGFRVWQRSVPLGGSHFTKALTKELKLTFAKAEHLKRNATTAQDPKAVFQAMRPVFSDLLTELQRSLGYFSNIDRAAKIGRVVALGNAFKLPGLRKYLSQSLGFEIERIEAYRGLAGPDIVGTPAFKENILSYGVCYGLVLQALGKGGLRTNLLPREMVKDRLIRQKKPWAVASAATLLLACGLSFAGMAVSLSMVDDDPWKKAESHASQVAGTSSRLKNEFDTTLKEFLTTKQIGDHLVNNVEGRAKWLELLLAINQCLPRDRQPVKQIADSAQLHITNIDCQQADDLAKWFAGVKKWYQPLSSEGSPADPAAAVAPTAPVPPAGPAVPGVPPAAAPAALPAGGVLAQAGPPAVPPAPGPPGLPAPVPGAGPADQPGLTSEDQGPSGPGTIIQIKGYHYHNEGENQGAEYLRRAFMKKLGSADEKILLPTGNKLPNGKEEMELVSLKDLGIGYPVLVNPGRIEKETLTSPTAVHGGGGGSGEGRTANRGPFGGGGPRVAVGGAGGGDDSAPAEETTKLDRFNFTIHFAWKPTSYRQRHEKKETKPGT
ncbi:MAG: pilus assembly protein PilM [Thermoguttaceae bacterium]|jgi:type IV pilus assembly protein PilM